MSRLGRVDILVIRASRLSIDTTDSGVNALSCSTGSLRELDPHRMRLRSDTVVYQGLNVLP